VPQCPVFDCGDGFRLHIHFSTNVHRSIPGRGPSHSIADDEDGEHHPDCHRDSVDRSAGHLNAGILHTRCDGKWEWFY